MLIRDKILPAVFFIHFECYTVAMITRYGAVKLLVYLGIFVIIGFGAASVLAQWQGNELPVINKVVTLPFAEKTPAEVLSSVFQNLAQDNAAYLFQAQLSWLNFNQPLTIDLQGKISGRLIGLGPRQSDWQAGVKVNGEDEIINWSIYQNANQAYFKATSLPRLPFIDLRQYLDKWYDLSSWQNNAIEPAWLADSLDTLTEKLDITRQPDETEDGKVFYSYQINIESREFANLFSVSGDNIINSACQGPGNVFPVSLFINKADLLLEKLTGKFNCPEFESSFELSKQPTLAVPVLPEEVRSGQEFFSDFFRSGNLFDLPIYGTWLGASTDPWLADQDEDGLVSFWENIFGSNNQSSDTDQDGFKDGEEVRNGYHPAKSGFLF